ncbi:MAG TPA: hypothetical protein VIN10_10715 [Bacteroidales bacterium]
METTNTFYPVFEPDQVLTSEHLNQLRRFLAAQDRQSRRWLHGIGIVCGLEVRNPGNDIIRISKGVGITSSGFLICQEEADCEFYRPYTDKVFTEVNCEMQLDGKYDLFLDKDNKQYDLWELLTAKEEADTDDPQIKPLNKAGNFLKMDEMYVLLYLEIEDLNMMACFGDDCDEKGIQRNFTVRKLMVRKDDLLEIIKEANKLDSKVSEKELNEEINAKYALEEVSIKRLGYDFSAKAITLSLKDYYDFDTLSKNYGSIIKQGILDVGKALHLAYEAYDDILKENFSDNPFKGFDAENPKENPLYSMLAKGIQKNRYSIQYVYDFLVDLIHAYYEFRKFAFELVSVCCPDKNLFPRHLMLGKAIVEKNTAPTIFRHYFIPSPISNQQKGLLDQVKLYFRRMVEMIKDFDLSALEMPDIRITPSPLYAFPLGKRAIPFYYKINDENGLNTVWNFENASKFRSRMELSYHADVYNTNSDEEFVQKPALWYYNQYNFLRVEGHVGKKYESAIRNILSLQERLNLPVKVIGLKLSRKFDNTTMTVECQFDDLQNLYRTFITELRCVLVEEAEFFRNLDTEPKGRKITGQDTIKKEGDTVLELLRSSLGKSGETEKLASGIRINTNVSGEKEASTIGESKLNLLGGNAYKFDTTREGTIGYLMDNITLGSGQNLYTSILNLYASGQFEFLYPGIFIYTILYPVQIASDIDNLLKNIPEKLEDFNKDILKKDYEALIQTAKSFKKSIQENLADPKYQRVGNEELILYRLDKLIYHCSINKIVELYRVYLKRVEEVKQMNLFARFAKDHPGMEHMAGVPKGGTLVLVYIDTNETVDFVPEREIREIVSSPDFLKRETSAKGVSNELRMNLSSGFNREIVDDGRDLIRRDFGRVQDEVPNNIVVADFALPYLCMGSCPEIATMIVSQITFSLEKNTFCANDEKQFPFIIDPKGGKVKGPGVTGLGADFNFVPAEANIEGEDVQFTYILNNQTVFFNAKIYNPVAGFEVLETSFNKEGNVVVKFANKSTGADQFKWDFGDGQTSEERDPTHIYTLFDGNTILVTLVAIRGECSNSFEKEIEIPQQDKIVFEIERNEYCGNDEKTYPFKTEPKGGVVSGEGVVSINGEFFFKPAAVDKKFETVTLTYTLENGQSASLTVTVFQVQADFNFKVHPFDPEIKGFKVEFFNKSTGATKFNWDFGDGETSDEVDPVHVYVNFDGTSANVTLVAFNDKKCRSTITKDVNFNREDGQERPLNVDNMRELSKLEMSTQVFGARNLLPTAMIKYYSTVQTDLNDSAILPEYVNGKKNDDIGNNLASFNKEINKSIGKLSKDDEELALKQEFAFKFMIMNLENLLELLSLLDKDIASTDAISSMFDSLIEILKTLSKEMNTDPDSVLSKMLNKAKRQFRSLPNIVGAVGALITAIK